MTKAQFVNMVADILDMSDDTLKGSEELSMLDGWDSLARLSFIAAVDKHLGTVVSTSDISSCITVDDLAALVQDRLGNNG